MSPFGSQAMLHGFFKPSATVTTLNCSPAGPGGCAHVEVETVNVAAATSTAAPRIDAMYFEVAFMDVPLVERPRASSKKDSAYRAADRSFPARTGVGTHLSATPRPDATEARREI